MKTLYFVRHGTVHNPNRIAYRRLPGFNLSDHGRLEAAETARFLQSIRFDAIWHSPLERAFETAEIINAPHRLELHVEERIIECDAGETPEEVRIRMASFIAEWKASGPESAIAVSHRDPIRRLLFEIHNEPWPDPDLADRFPLSQAGVYRITERSGTIEAELTFTPTFSTDANL